MALLDPQGHESTGESPHKDCRGCYGDQINCPWMAASANKIEMSGTAFVPICVKTHGSDPLLRGEWLIN